MPSLSVPDNLIGSVTETLSGSFEGLGPVIYLVLGVYLGLFVLEALIRIGRSFLEKRFRIVRSFLERRARERRENRPDRADVIVKSSDRPTTQGVTQRGDNTIDLSGEADIIIEQDND